MNRKRNKLIKNEQKEMKRKRNREEKKKKIKLKKMVSEENVNSTSEQCQQTDGLFKKHCSHI
jgi:hypothetical protein